ncbi:cytochrome P450 family protein [Ceratobasidium sp. AG-Ba]|nr:cytochrome P450 family protein [Ceratobasidium sp. AG-Ba]
MAKSLVSSFAAHTLFGSNAIRYILLGTSITLAISIRYLELARARGSSPPNVPGHWLFKNKKLLLSPWRAVVLAEKYVPKYGDIFQLSTISRRVLVLNSLQAVTEVLEKQAAATSDRPPNIMMFDLCELGLTATFRNQDELQKKQRRVIASALHPAAARSYATLHSATSAFFLRDLADRINALSNTEPAITQSSHFDPLIASIRDSIGRFIVQMTYGHVVAEDDPWLQRVREQTSFMVSGLSKHYWVNDFPILRYVPAWFPGAKFKRDAIQYRERQAKIRAEPFELVLKNVVEGNVARPSYVSKLLELKSGANASQDDLELIKWTSQPMFTAGTATTVALILSFFFMMSIHPEIASRVQAEIDTQVGRNRFPTLQDKDLMPYADAVLQEVIRHCPVAPFGFPHFTTKDIEVCGYNIKKGTTIEPNVWALMHEASTYPDPHSFNPDRFLKQTPDPDPRRFLFGFGRRVCPGQHVADNGAFTTCAAFMSVFNITAGEGTMRAADKHGKELWKMFTQYGAFHPQPFACTVQPRDQAATALLERCKEIQAMD